MKSLVSKLFLVIVGSLGPIGAHSKEVNMTDRELFDAHNRVFEELRGKEIDLYKIRNSSDSIVIRWQNLLQILLPIQLKVAEFFGFEKNQMGLSRFNKQVMEASASNSELSALNKQKWMFLFQTAFDVEESSSLTLQEARDLVKAISDEMMSEKFLKAIDDKLNASSKNLDMLERRQGLLDILFPLHMSVMEKHGFIGEKGYVLAQRALLEYYHDDIIKELSTKAQKIIFERAGLL